MWPTFMSRMDITVIEFFVVFLFVGRILRKLKYAVQQIWGGGRGLELVEMGNYVNEIKEKTEIYGISHKECSQMCTSSIPNVKIVLKKSFFPRTWKFSIRLPPKINSNFFNLLQIWRQMKKSLVKFHRDNKSLHNLESSFLAPTRNPHKTPETLHKLNSPLL